MHDSTLKELENLFLALSDKTRLRLLSLMADGEVSVGYLADSLGESQPKISRHLAYLRNAGLVSTRREGKWIYYNVQRPSDAVAGDVLDAAFGQRTGDQAVNSYANYTEPASSHSYDDYTFDETDMKPQEKEELEIYLL